MSELEKYIKGEVEEFRLAAYFGDVPSEAYIINICEEYYRLKTIELNKDNPIVTLIREGVGTYTCTIDATHIKPKTID